MHLLVWHRSGSMTGKRIVLAQLTVVQILKSLTDDDYFLVLKVYIKIIAWIHHVMCNAFNISSKDSVPVIG